MAAIPDEAQHLFEGKELAHIATLNADGSPQVSAVWVGLDGDLVTFNTAEGRVRTSTPTRASRSRSPARRTLTKTWSSRARSSR